MLIAITDPLTGAIAEADVPDADWQRLVDASSPKLSNKRPLTIDPPPAPSATQAVEFAGYVIEPERVRKTWALRDKTADELNDAAQAAERDALVALIAALQADVDAGITAAPTNLAAAATDIQELKRRQRRADRVLLWLLRNRV